MRFLFLAFVLLTANAMAESSIGVVSQGKMVAAAHVDFTIIIPPMVGMVNGVMVNNTKSRAIMKLSCDSNNVCTSVSP